MPDQSTSPDTDLAPSLGGKGAPRSDDAPRLGGHAALAHLLEAAQDPDPAIRQRAADALGELGGDQAIERLMELLSDEHADLRAQAARALGRVRTTQAVDALLGALQDDSERVRWNAAEALGRIGDEHAVTHLIAALRDRDQVVREHAAEALGGIGELLPPGPVRDSIATALLDGLRITSSVFYPRLSHIVARSLLQLGDAAVPPLIAVLRRGDGRPSESAAEMLAAHALHTRDESLRAEIALALVEAAGSREPFISRAAIRAIGQSAPALVHENDLRLALRTIQGLLALYDHSAGLSPEEFLAILRGAVRESNSVRARDYGYTRPDLVHTLGRLGAEHKDLALAVMPRLIQALYDDDPGVRRVAIEGMGRITGPHPDAVVDAIPALASRLGDDAGRPFSLEPRIGDTAAALLRQLGTPEARDALAKAGRE